MRTDLKGRREDRAPDVAPRKLTIYYAAGEDPWLADDEEWTWWEVRSVCDRIIDLTWSAEEAAEEDE